MPGRVLLATEWSPQTTEIGDSAEVEETAPFELDLHVRTIPFIAAVDRIELDSLRQRLVVVDYKTGRPRWAGQLAAQLRAGTHLQLPLYARAVEQVVQADPERLGLPGPGPVGALRLEYLQRPLPRGTKPGRPEARGFAPHGPLGVDASGQVWTVLNAAMSFTVAFVAAIEAGTFPLVAREPTLGGRPGFGTALRFAELARFVPGPERRITSLPPALLPLPDPRANREVVR